MADLPTVADRINDIEVSSNAPQTETLWRRIGSNINILLDAFGLADGDTSAAGDLNDLTIALSTIRAHTMTLQFTNPGNGLHTIGSFAQIPFVDFIFWAEDLGTDVSPGSGSGARLVPIISYDSGVSFKHINASKVTPSVTSVSSSASLGKAGGTRSDYVPPTTTPSAAAFDRFFDAALGIIGFEHRMRTEAWQVIATIDWRDMPAAAGSTVLDYYNEGAGTTKFYLQYKLNLESAFLVAP